MFGVGKGQYARHPLPNAGVPTSSPLPFCVRPCSLHRLSITAKAVLTIQGPPPSDSSSKGSPAEASRSSTSTLTLSVSGEGEHKSASSSRDIASSFLLGICRCYCLLGVLRQIPRRSRYCLAWLTFLKVGARLAARF